LSLLGPAAPLALAAEAPGAATAPAVVDGVTLFRVRGLSAYPPDERASAIADRIRVAAADPGVAIGSLRVVPGERSSDIVMGGQPPHLRVRGRCGGRGVPPRRPRPRVCPTRPRRSRGVSPGALHQD